MWPNHLTVLHSTDSVISLHIFTWYPKPATYIFFFFFCNYFTPLNSSTSVHKHSLTLSDCSHFVVLIPCQFFTIHEKIQTIFGLLWLGPSDTNRRAEVLTFHSCRTTGTYHGTGLPIYSYWYTFLVYSLIGEYGLHHERRQFHNVTAQQRASATKPWDWTPSSSYQFYPISFVIVKIIFWTYEGMYSYFQYHWEEVAKKKKNLTTNQFVTYKCVYLSKYIIQGMSSVYAVLPIIYFLSSLALKLCSLTALVS